MKRINKKALSRIKDMLINQKLELQSKTYNHEVDFDGDETDEIQGKLIASVNSKLSSRDKEKLHKIDNALKKIDDNTFGLCEECGELIAEKRLEINPYFPTCIDCAEELEREEKRKMIV